MFVYHVSCFADNGPFVEDSQVGRIAALLVLKGRCPGVRVHIRPEQVNSKFIDWNERLKYDEPTTEEEEFTWG